MIHHNNNLRMRIQLSPEESDEMAQLRAFYTLQDDGIVTAHRVVRAAIRDMHRKVFIEDGNAIPSEWRYYTK